MSEYYSQFTGIKRSDNQVDAPQVSFLKLDNYFVNQTQNALKKRGGSTAWDTTGDILGISSYSKSNNSYLIPNTEIVLRHRRDGSTSYIEKLDWTASTWSAITLGANTSFGAAGVMQFAQHNTMMMICGGRPAKITDITSGSISRLGGPAPTAAPTWALVAGTLTGQTQGYYTFYDSTTGWESSPSPLTSLTTVSSNQINWSALETSCAREGVDKKRLYRTQVGAQGSGPFYRVTEIALATTTYNDTVADASLGASGPDLYDHNPPPTTSYICAEYENVFWIASGNEVYYSKPFDGTLPSLEYFSPDRVFRFPATVTGLVYTPDFGKLLVFLPAGKGIYAISGRSESQFEQSLFKSSEGTNFPASISHHEEMVGYWGINGPSVITPAGIAANFSKDISEMLHEYTNKDYGSEVFIWSEWHPHYGFFFGLGATDALVSQWEDDVTGGSVGWEDAVSGATVEWE